MIYACDFLMPSIMLKRWFDDVWVLRYDCEYVDWVMFYVLYEKLKMHAMMERFYKKHEMIWAA
jgi:hypothetical protein